MPDVAKAPGPTHVGPPSAERSLEELRALLGGHRDDDLNSARDRLDRIERRIEEIADALAEATRLPEAVERHGGTDTALQRALTPDVEHILHASVRERPDRMAEAIYPIMGPVIRRIVEQLFERATKPGGAGGGVEQLFLMHRASGLLIAHVGRDDVVSSDPDMVSGMLSAIRSFVQEAFGANDFDGLHTMRVGDMNIRVAWGPSVVLAGVVRGVEPTGLSIAMEELLAELHRERSAELEARHIDDAAFADVPARLEALLSARAAPTALSRWRGHAALAAIGLGAVLLVTSAGNARDSARWQRFVDRLDASPGIAVVGASREDGQHLVRILRDPDAADPRSLLGPNPGTDPSDVDIVETPFDGLLETSDGPAER